MRGGSALSYTTLWGTTHFVAIPEPAIRIASFLVIFGSMAVFELFLPRLARPEMVGAIKSRRWLTNISLVVISSVVLRMVFPAAAVGAAAWAAASGIGVLHLLSLPAWLAGVVALLVLDFAVWLEHVASHKLPLLWSIHRVHHSDTGFDLSTALRFHPLEIVLSMVWKAGIVLALGAPVWAVLVFEIVLNGAAMFNHANIKLPPRLDRVLRTVIVTPDMHRIHHSVVRVETDSNYGFNLSWWDRLFATYRATPAAGNEGLIIGLSEYRDLPPKTLTSLLMLPLGRK
jgi:sterol desaturase/sphingolipid hydroxylase (fatty acid hydroxylase superfamily)